MAITYPTTLDTFTNPTTSSLLTSPSHAQQHSDINDAVEALEAKVAVGNTVLGTYTSYTPTYPTGLTVGNATVTSQYARVNNFVHYWGRVVWGSTTSTNASGVNISLPITADTNFITGAATTVGTAGYRNTTGSLSYTGSVVMVSGAANQASLQIMVSSGAYTSQTILTSTVPFTWVTGDTMWWNFMYKAA